MVLLRRDVQCLCYQFSQGDIPRVVQTQDIFSGVEGVDRWPSIRAFIWGKGDFRMKKLNTINADTQQIIPHAPLVRRGGDLLPQGLHLLAGAPKIGKSRLAL